MIENTAVEQQQIKKISGKITDENGEAIPGANILEKGTTNGTISDMDGNYTGMRILELILHFLLKMLKLSMQMLITLA